MRDEARSISVVCVHVGGGEDRTGRGGSRVFAERVSSAQVRETCEGGAGWSWRRGEGGGVNE